MTSAFSAWILAIMVVLGATEHVTPPPELAASIATVATAQPLAGALGAERMAAVLVALAWNESRFDVDAIGDCHDPAHRTRDTCASWGPFQIGKGWTRGRPGLDGETELAARLVHESFRACAARPLDARLSWYAAGGAACDERGVRASRWRMGLAARLLREHAPPARAPPDVDPKPGRWEFHGTGYADLSLVAGSSSILLTSGEIR